MKILFVSNLYPSTIDPGMASYNRQLVEALARQAEIRVVAPVAWFPGQRILRGRTLPPKNETLGGIRVTHPRFFYTPGVLIHHHWRFYRTSVAQHLRRVIAEFAPDHVVAGFLYPDGAAVLSLCQTMGIPCSVRVNGSDFRLRMTQPRFKPKVLEVLRSAETVVCPGQALQRDILAAGIEPSKVFAFNNGVNHDLFRILPMTEAIEALLATGNTATTKAIKRIKAGSQAVLYVGHLRHIKGADRMVRAFQSFGQLPQGKEATLVVIGHGRMLTQLKREVEDCGMSERVFFVGDRPHAEVA
ncbi:MAG: glycosyltransferase, partial [Kiritimatiellia bacterium]|nr:glycosyltransferase [Kiritimatiellia bacterium]